ncbi:restriction endonuclease subunit S [Flavobacterium amnicola]|uniref:Restriction endonuclease subunit S n=1 Tax=Flavobacterium amnicola TaxID=2506422 RepID=A0A4Q1K3I4_9FLAO|nr:restriction endonuclease subunit S [Flavobacterium amnicola]RXR19349.1 restriction endonuclease subunit S [Flavobacterium amnicola]
MPNNWKTYKLSDFIDINPLVKLKANQSYSFVEMKDLDANLKTVRPSDFKTLKGGAKFQNNDTLFARITPCLENGKICQVRDLENNVGFGSTEFLVFRGKENISDSDFVYYLSREPFVRQFAESNMIGTSGRQRVAKEAFQNIELELPPIQEQKSIASILSAIDDKIENNLAINKTLEEMAMALYKHWFVDFGPFQDGEFVESEFGRIPKGWEVKSVYDIANYINGAAFKPSELVDEGKYVIKISELNGGITKNTGKSNKEVKPEQVINNGSVLFSWSATLDIFLWDKGEALLNQHIFNVLPNGSLSIEILYFLLKNIIAHFKSIAADRATTMGHIKISHLKETFLAIPNKNHKQEFQKIIEPIFNQILENLTENQTLTQLRDTLLPKLISGAVRLKEFRE